LEALAEIGIPAQKIRLVFNMVELDETPQRAFAGLFDYHASKKNFTLKPEAVIHVNDIFGKFKSSEQSIAAILHDPADLKAQLKEATDPVEKLRIAQLIAIKRLAAGVTEELDSVFKTLFK